jgi:hypothetical protein
MNLRACDRIPPSGGSRETGAGDGEEGGQSKAVGMARKTANQVYQFKITLKGIRPPIWRRIQVPDTYSFWDLHVAIQDAMGWMDYHLHEFIVSDPGGGDRVRIGVPDPEYGLQTVLPEEKHFIADWFSPEGDPALYTYDFGDDWEHKVKLEKILPREEGEDYPRCMGGKRACPPEDCGGPWGYRRMLEVLADPGNEEYEDMLEWLVGGFEPELFHPDAVVFMDPDMRRKYLEGSWAAPVAGPRGTDPEEYGEEAYADPYVADLMDRIRSGELPLSEYKDELDALMPNSILASAAAVDAAVDGHEKGEITHEEAEEIIRKQADLHPLHPFLFEMCAVYALPHMDELDVFGYMALTVKKSERLRELTGEDFIGDTPDGAPTGFRELMQKIGESEELLEVQAYVAKCGDHLVNHFLVDEMLGSCWEMDGELLDLVLERSERLAPIAIAMCEDLLHELDPDLLPFGIVYLLRLIGCLKTREALPMLMRALQECCGEPLHETVLALAKLGSLHPDEVSSGLRGVAADPAYYDVRLAAIEVLGLLGKEAGNFDFLRETLLRLDPKDPYYHDMFVFLVQALASSGHGKAREVIGAALEKHGHAIPDGVAAFTRAFLEDPGFTGMSCRLEDLVEEDMSDLRELELDFEVDMRRSTMTREREEDLELVEEDEEE